MSVECRKLYRCEWCSWVSNVAGDAVNPAGWYRLRLHRPDMNPLEDELADNELLCPKCVERVAALFPEETA